MAVDPCLVLHENDSETWGLQIAELLSLSLVDYRRFAFGASKLFREKFSEASAEIKLLKLLEN